MLPAALALAAPGAHLAALIKPQFEVGKGRVGKGGIVREPELHDEVCDTISAWLAEQPGWRVLGVTESPITGAEGNKEFLIAGQLLQRMTRASHPELVVVGQRLERGEVLPSAAARRAGRGWRPCRSGRPASARARRPR